MDMDMDGDMTVETDFTTKPGALDALEPVGEAEVMARMLREGRVATFNTRVSENGPADLTNANLRMADLRGADLKGASLKGAYLRAADLRGQDLSSCDMEGASIGAAKISGVFFPTNLSADEITMSVAHGTRMRVRGA
jgi:hypothetical protein